MAVAAVKTPENEPEKAPLGINSLTASEINMAEQAAKMGMGIFAEPDKPQVGLKAALAWVLERRTDNKLGYQQYMNNHTLAQINEVLFPGDDDEDEESGKEE